MSSFFASRADLTKQITKETAEWADVIKKAGVVLE
jgi:tripartite-type tricarboxylate transporter receptor subunit TctC